MKPKIGVITIGQSPRTDMIPVIKHFFQEGTVFLEKGVLDDKSDEQIAALAPADDETTLISRMRDGGHAVMAKEKILPIIQELINDLHIQEVDLIILACTGKFPAFQSDIPIIYPDYLLNKVVKGIFQAGQLGVIIPLPEQKESIMEKWQTENLIAIPAACSPYTFEKEKLIEATKQLNDTNAKAIILDCMGYTNEMKQIAQAHTKKPVILARDMVYKVVAEVVS